MKISSVPAWILSGVLLIGTLVSITAAVGQKTSNSSSGAKLWISSLDTDHDGTVSREEFMLYMDTQFAKADTDHDGTLDKNELEQLRQNLATATKR